jgi:hypothetical protein
VVTSGSFAICLDIERIEVADVCLVRAGRDTNPHLAAHFFQAKGKPFSRRRMSAIWSDDSSSHGSVPLATASSRTNPGFFRHDPRAQRIGQCGQRRAVNGRTVGNACRAWRFAAIMVIAG